MDPSAGGGVEPPPVLPLLPDRCYLSFSSAPASASRGLCWRPGLVPRVEGDDASGEGFVGGVGQSSALHPLYQSFGIGKFSYALHEVRIRIAITGNIFSKGWDNLKAVRVVKGLQYGMVDTREFQTQESSTWFEDTSRFVQGIIDACDIAQSKCNRVQIHRIGSDIGQTFRVALLESQGMTGVQEGRSVSFSGPALSDPEHLGVDVADGDLDRIDP